MTQLAKPTLLNSINQERIESVDNMNTNQNSSGSDTISNHNSSSSNSSSGSGSGSDTSTGNTQSSASSCFYGAYGHLRQKLDYQYHVHYRKQRQLLHDAIIEDYLDYQDYDDDLLEENDDDNNNNNNNNINSTSTSTSEQPNNPMSTTTLNQDVENSSFIDHNGTTITDPNSNNMNKRKVPSSPHSLELDPSSSSSSPSILIQNQTQQPTTSNTTTTSTSTNMNTTNTTTTTHPWLILAVGVQGTGKHYVINKLLQNNLLQLTLSFVSIAPDDIGKHLPEYSTFLEYNHDNDPNQQQLLLIQDYYKEIGYIVETIILASLQLNRNVLLHCQIHDIQWYQYYIKHYLRIEYPSIRIAMFHIKADHHTILQRRCKQQQIQQQQQSNHQYTNKYRNEKEEDTETNNNNNNISTTVNDGTITTTATTVSSLSKKCDSIYPTITMDRIEKEVNRLPYAVNALKPYVDYFCEIHNVLNNDPIIITNTNHNNSNNNSSSRSNEMDDWNIFRNVFQQSPVQQDRSCTTPTLPIHGCCRKKCPIKPFNPNVPTSVLHQFDPMIFYGPFAHLREELDYTYHTNYTKERQRVQDTIIQEFLKAAIIRDKFGEVCTTPTEPWIVFTAGAMGAGKSYTMNQLVQNGYFPLLAFIQVDPDRIRRYLPEFPLYVHHNPMNAGELTGKEAGCIAELLTLAGLYAGKNVMVDGSLRHAIWYQEYFHKLRQQFTNLRIAIIHVTAPPEAVIERAKMRAQQTGRVVPCSVLLEALRQVPKSVEQLAPLVDYHVEVHNASNDGTDIQLITSGETWESFRKQWIQTCAWIPTSKKKLLKKTKESEIRLAASLEV